MIAECATVTQRKQYYYFHFISKNDLSKNALDVKKFPYFCHPKIQGYWVMV